MRARAAVCRRDALFQDPTPLSAFPFIHVTIDSVTAYAPLAVLLFPCFLHPYSVEKGPCVKRFIVMRFMLNHPLLLQAKEAWSCGRRDDYASISYFTF